VIRVQGQPAAEVGGRAKSSPAETLLKMGRGGQLGGGNEQETLTKRGGQWVCSTNKWAVRGMKVIPSELKKTDFWAESKVGKIEGGQVKGDKKKGSDDIDQFSKTG